MKSNALKVATSAIPEPARKSAPPEEPRSSASAPADGQGPRILLIAQKGTARALYHQVIRQTGARVDTVASLTDFQGAVRTSAYNGIVIDIPTKIQALNRHKGLVNTILDRFPVIQVNQEKATGRIRALLYGRHERHGPLQELIREACLNRPPRRFRAAQRRNIHFNVLLARSRRFDAGEIERTVTMNVSEDGCFIYTTARFQQGQRVWIRIMEFYDKTPIACEVIHKRKWGREMGIPGIGVCFRSLTEGQAHGFREQCGASPTLERIAPRP